VLYYYIKRINNLKVKGQSLLCDYKGICCKKGFWQNQSIVTTSQNMQDFAGKGGWREKVELKDCWCLGLVEMCIEPLSLSLPLALVQS